MPISVITKTAISKDTLSVIPACLESFFNNPLYPPFLRGTKKDSRCESSLRVAPTGQARMTTCIGNVVLLMAQQFSVNLKTLEIASLRSQ